MHSFINKYYDETKTTATMTRISSIFIVGAAASSLRGADPAGNKAMALSGGGFLALSTYAGLAADTDLSGKFALFDTISTVSGGSWFLAELAYSDTFANLVQSLGNPVMEAENTFQALWVKPFEKEIQQRGGTSLSGALVDVLKHLKLGKDDDFTKWIDDVEMAGAFGINNGAFNWTEAVSGLLSTQGILSSTKTSAKVGSWAQGKTWLVGTTVSGDATLWENTFHNLEYKSKDHQPPPANQYPSRFTVGLGVKAPSNIFCPACDDLTFEYDGVGHCAFLGFKCQKQNGASSPLGTDMDANNLRLSHIVAASSAFLGGVAESPDLRSHQNLFSAPGGVFVPFASSGASDGFRILSAIDKAGEVDAAAMIQASESQVKAVIDGAYTDNTGIANAVAAGHTDIVAWIQGTGMDTPSSLQDLFAGARSTVEQSMGIVQSRFQIFSFPTSSQFNIDFANWDSLHVQGTSQLEGIKYATVQATTAANRFFGIKDALKINLRIVYVGSKLNMGVGMKLEDYSTLVGEIVNTIRSNKFDPFAVAFEN